MNVNALKKYNWKIHFSRMFSGENKISTGVCCFLSGSLQKHWRIQGMTAQVVGPLIDSWEIQMQFQVNSFSKPSQGCSCHLRSKLVHGKFLCVSASLSVTFPFKLINKSLENKNQKQTNKNWGWAFLIVKFLFRFPDSS